MAARPVYRVIDRRALRQASDGTIGRIAEEFRRDVAARTPGHLAALWRVMPTDGIPAKRHVVNTSEIARSVEFGTKRTRAHPFLGPTVAAWRSKLRGSA